MGKIILVTLLLLFPPVVLGTLGCGEGQGGMTGEDGGPDIDPGPPPNPIGDRVNPLQEHIRTYWTGGDPDSTGGYHRGHIKTYGQCWTNYANITDGDNQAQFIADNFDMYVWGGAIVGQHMAGQSTVWIAHTTDIPTIGTDYDSLMISRWLADPTRNVHGYRFDDLLMHYKYDVQTWLGSTPGWNPADDFDGDSCADRPPSRTNRTAPCLRDAEVHVPNYWMPGQFVWRAKIMHPGYTGYVIDGAVDLWTQTRCDGFHYDTAAYENWSIELGKTFTYDGYDEADPDFPMRTDQLLFVPTVAKAIEEKIGHRAIHIANTVSPSYTCRIPESKEPSLRYVENTLNETWMQTNSNGRNVMTTSRRQDFINCPYLDWLEQGKGYVFACFDELGSDRGKRFSLATFYLINHQMAFYFYRTDDHLVRDGEYVWDKQWNEYVDFGVGSPAVNSFGFPDFQGGYGTNRYFVWATDADYEILGREYLRGDGRRVLVLVKLMADGMTEDTSPTIHQLPHPYRAVKPDLTLDDPVTQVELRNNDAVILVEDGG
jgi:hypothetical protein